MDSFSEQFCLPIRPCKSYQAHIFKRPSAIYINLFRFPSSNIIRVVAPTINGINNNIRYNPVDIVGLVFYELFASWTLNDEVHCLNSFAIGNFYTTNLVRQEFFPPQAIDV